MTGRCCKTRLTKSLCITGMFVLFFAVLCLSFPVAAETGELSISLPETVKGYTPCEIVIQSPVAGEAELKLFDGTQNLWLVRKEQLKEGENIIPWDGLGEGGERMFAGPYRFVVKIKTEDGKELAKEKKFNISGTTETLVYALPSSDILYLEGGDRWFVECYVSAKCLVAMEVRDSEGNVVYFRDENVLDPDGVSIYWNGALDTRNRIAPGEYTVRMWGKLNPEYDHVFPLTVAETAPPKPEITATGPVMPERGMSDEEIWEIMMKPSVVINDNGSFRRFNRYGVPKTGTRAVGTLRCALQGLEILDTDGIWAHVRAGRHEDGRMAEGYYLVKNLTVYNPNPHYGVLIDKKDQTLTVFEDGKRIGSVPVSTGLVTPGNQYRETPPGAFLTDVHTGASFAQEGYRYEYPLRYDGGNYIHGAGYVRNGRSRDYSNHEQLLGQKASHGCTRVSLFRRGDSPINMYWLWIHLPYHTRIIILDD